MPRERSPNRDRAHQLWLEREGNISNREIAERLGENEKVIAVWKSRDAWNVVQQSNESCTTNPKGAPKGNRNAARHGAPRRNSNAAGNRGGHGGPPGNKKAVTTGEYEAIWFDTLDEDERQLVGQVPTDPLVQLNDEITLLAIRERRMLLRIRRLTEGLTEKQRRVLQERRKVKEAVPVPTGTSGNSTTVLRDNYQLVVTESEETEFRPIEDILRLEEALTRIQDKKLKALEIKQKHMPNGDAESAMNLQFVDDIDDD